MKPARIIAAVVALAVMSLQAEACTFSLTAKKTPQDFNEFLNDCTLDERIQIMQSLQDLSLQELQLSRLSRNTAVVSREIRHHVWDIISAENKIVSDFIITVNLIKTRKYAK